MFIKSVLIVILSILSVEEKPKSKLQKLCEHPSIISMWKQNSALRNSIRLSVQKLNPSLVCAAQDHANYMARTGQFGHFINGGPNGRARKYGYRGTVAENIARGQRSIPEVFQDWRKSRGHFRNMCSNAARVGFGCQLNKNGQWYWVTLYGY